MKPAKGKSLKSANFKWLVGLALADAVVLALIDLPSLDTQALRNLAPQRAVAALVFPYVVLLLVNVIPHNVKAMLVYWKPPGVLPGREAFTRYGPADGRFDMNALAAKIGPLPSSPEEQNTRWYSLYREVSEDVAVKDAHGHYLLYRDAATLSFLLAAICGIALMLGLPYPRMWMATLLFSIQYILSALSGRWSGIRFVCNVLAAHSGGVAMKPKTPRKPRGAKSKGPEAP